MDPSSPSDRNLEDPDDLEDVLQEILNRLTDLERRVEDLETEG